MWTSGIGGPSPFAPPASAPGLTAASKPPSVEDEFLKWATMTPAQRMRANILSSMGLTEDDLKAMDAEKRQKAEEEIRKRIEDQIVKSDKRPGLLVDVRA